MVLTGAARFSFGPVDAYYWRLMWPLYAYVHIVVSPNDSSFMSPTRTYIFCIRPYNDDNQLSILLSLLSVKESCLILLQTIPGSIDIDLFKADLLKSFEAIVSVHDLHIWQLSHDKYVSTVHITFQTPNVSHIFRCSIRYAASYEPMSLCVAISLCKSFALWHPFICLAGLQWTGRWVHHYSIAGVIKISNKVATRPFFATRLAFYLRPDRHRFIIRLDASIP